MASLKSLYRQHQYVTLATEDRDGIATAQQRVGAGVLVLDGALSSGGTYTAADGGTSCKVGHQVAIYSAADINTIVFTVVGTDPDGYALSETITGVNAGAVESTNYFYTVTSVSSNGTVGSNVEVGIVDEVATQRVLIEPRSNFAVGIGVHVSGTASVTAQVSMSDPYDSDITPTYIADTTLATKTATFYSSLGVVVAAVRYVTNSYSTGAVIQCHTIQNKD